MKPFKSEDLVTAKEAMQIIGIYNPDKHKVCRAWRMKRAFEQGVVRRIELNSRVIKYVRSDCEEFFQKLMSGKATLSF